MSNLINEPLAPDKNNELYHKSGANFMFLPLSAEKGTHTSR